MIGEWCDVQKAVTIREWNKCNAFVFTIKIEWNDPIILGAIHKRRQNFLGRFLYPPPPCRNFDPDLQNSDI